MMNGTYRLVLLTLAGCLVAMPATSHAQAPDWLARSPELSGYMMIGGAALDLDGLNGALAGRGFGEVSGNTFVMGGGAHVQFGRWLLGGEGFGLFPRDTDTAAGDWRARVSGGGGVVNVGYAILRLGGTTIYPLVGIGVGALTLEMTERTSPTFDEVIANPGRGSTLNQVAMLVQPAVGFDHFIPVAVAGDRRAGVVVGVRVGYTFSPVTSAWYLDTTRLPGGVDQGIEGAFVRVTIGGGTRAPAGRADTDSR